MNTFKKIKKIKIIKDLIQVCKVPFFLPYYYITRYIFKFKVSSPIETVKQIKNESRSVSRFGDGELKIIFHNKSIGFQPFSEKLKKDLILSSKSGNVALPHGFVTTKNDRFLVKAFWWMFVTLNYRQILEFVRSSGQIEFLDTNFSRTITELKDKNVISATVGNTKSLWENKNVLIIEGEGTRFGVGNSLLDNSKDVFRIIAPSENAYEKIYEIEELSRKFIDNNKLKNSWNNSNFIILISLGPTATVLADKLRDLGQVLDIGHFDLQFEYLKNGKYVATKVLNKYDNEKFEGNIVTTLVDSNYENSIVGRTKDDSQ